MRNTRQDLGGKGEAKGGASAWLLLNTSLYVLNMQEAYNHLPVLNVFAFVLQLPCIEAAGITFKPSPSSFLGVISKKK